MSAPWYAGYEMTYRGSEEEHNAFIEWMNVEHPSESIPDRTDVDYDDLMEDYRDTQSWEDGFLDYAWPIAVRDGRASEDDVM